jgi:L-fuconolactonase
MKSAYDPQTNAVRTLRECNRWQQASQEPPLEPALPIADPHHHLWPNSRNTYLPSDLLEDIGHGHNVISTVYVECGSSYRRTGPTAMRPVGETEFVLEATEKANASRILCKGIVAHANLGLGDRVAAVLEAQAIAAKGRLRGIRHSLRWDEAGIGHFGRQLPSSLALDAQFREGFAQLAQFGLTFDAWAFHHQLDEVASLARAFPATPFVVNHFGGPLGVGAYKDRRREVFARWRSGIHELARCPNVAMKLSGIGMLYFGFDFYKRKSPPNSAEIATHWAPYVETCLNAFGVSRCMFASNYPVDKQSCSYTTLWNACKLLTTSMSTDERSQLFRDNAVKTYRLF